MLKLTFAQLGDCTSSSLMLRFLEVKTYASIIVSTKHFVINKKKLLRVEFHYVIKKRERFRLKVLKS